MIALDLAATSLRRIVRDRTTLFFLVALPVFIILVIGTFTSSFDGFRLVVIDEDKSTLSERLVGTLVGEQDLDVEVKDDLGTARRALRRTEIHAVVVIPQGYGSQLGSGAASAVTVLGELTNDTQRAARTAVARVVTSEGASLQAAQYVAATAGGSVEDRLALVDPIVDDVPAVNVERLTIDAESTTLPLGYSYSAPTMLVLFVFINCLAAGAAIIQTRDLRLYERMLAAPVGAPAIVAGETLAYLGLALLQSLLIVGVGAVLFGVGWGNPPAAAALVLVWALVATGAGVLSGTLFRTTEQAGSIGPAVGIAFGMLGGCMWPLEIVPPFMRTIGHIVPHGWAVDGWTKILAEGAGVGRILTQLFVLAGFAAVLLMLASIRLRNSLAD